jgi:hypothetical protein
MTPADFFLFPRLKLPLRGTCFQSVEDIKENTRRELNSIPETAFKNVMMIGLFVDVSVLQKISNVVAEGAYFDGYKINLDK